MLKLKPSERIARFTDTRAAYWLRSHGAAVKELPDGWVLEWGGQKVEGLDSMALRTISDLVLEAYGRGMQYEATLSQHQGEEVEA